MKNKIVELIDDSLVSYNQYKDYISKNFTSGITDRMLKVKLASANIKMNHYCTKVIILVDLLDKVFDEKYNLPEEMKIEKDNYFSMLDSISIESGDVKYENSFQNLFTDLERKMKLDGKETK